jgi:hypothetical protein
MCGRRQISLLDTQFFEPVPDYQCKIHGCAFWIELMS